MLVQGCVCGPQVLGERAALDTDAGRCRGREPRPFAPLLPRGCLCARRPRSHVPAGGAHSGRCRPGFLGSQPHYFAVAAGEGKNFQLGLLALPCLSLDLHPISQQGQVFRGGLLWLVSLGHAPLLPQPWLPI